MKLGIIGLDGAGRTTIFEALTRLAADRESAGSRLEGRVGTIRVPDGRVDFLSGMFQPKKTIHAQIEYVLPQLKVLKQDQAREESVWAEVKNCDALIHVLRNFNVYGQGPPDAARDFYQLDQEMIFTDLMIVEKRLERLELDRKRGKKSDPEELRLLTECRELLEKEMPLRRNPQLAAAPQLKGYTFISAKPMLVLFNNADEDEIMPAAAGSVLAAEKSLVVRGALEHELCRLSAEEAREFLEEFHVTASAMDLVIAESYRLLGLISFFTVGEDEVRAWTIKAGTMAVDAAEVIHSDIKKGFIRAEVIAYKDLAAAGSHKEARKAGTLRLEGRTYQVQDGDIIEFRFNI